MIPLKIIQVGVFLFFWFGAMYVAQETGNPINGAEFIIALGLTVLVFAPAMHLQLWLARRRSRRALTLDNPRR